MQTPIKIKDLEIGDVVKLLPVQENEVNLEMTVINKTTEKITFFRPYVTLANFIYTGGVIPYIGVNQFDVLLNNPCEYMRIANIFYPKINH